MKKEQNSDLKQCLTYFVLLCFLFIFPSCATNPPQMIQWVNWPEYGEPGDGLDLDGHTNNLPDFVGPIDGSAKLTIFTEGNHFPILLPLVLEQFPAWCKANCDIDIKTNEILIVTLPQVMVVNALSSEQIALGNAILPIRREGVFPDIIMGGDRPLGRLATMEIIEPNAIPFAKHRGMGLLLRKEYADQVITLDDLKYQSLRVVVATPNEAGARRQYRQTLDVLMGQSAADQIFAQEVPTFPGRLMIQHRDIPYALLTDQADVGLIFGHLADFYAKSFPEQLAYVPVEEAAEFGQTINIAQVSEQKNPIAQCFQRFLLAQARTYYPARGFASVDTFTYGQPIMLKAK